MFGRKKKTDATVDEQAAVEVRDEVSADATATGEQETSELAAEPRDAVEVEIDEPASEPAAEVAQDTPAAAPDDDADDTDDTDEWDALQASRDWRDDGPFDIDEVDLDDDDVQRMDFGSLIITPTENSSMQLQVDQETNAVQAALVMIGNSGLEIALFAAPSSGGLSSTVRREMMASVEQTGGSCECAEGPFGVEVRRIAPVRMPDGQEGLHVSRTWMAEGPRWLLRGVLMGEACVSEDPSLQEDFVEFFKNIIVRRGDLPLPPGDLVPMTLPPEIQPAPQA